MYQRIMAAAAKGRGVRLSAGETFLLSQDTAISEAAAMDDEHDATTTTSYPNAHGHRPEDTDDRQ